MMGVTPHITLMVGMTFTTTFWSHWCKLLFGVVFLSSDSNFFERQILGIDSTSFDEPNTESTSLCCFLTTQAYSSFNKEFNFLHWGLNTGDADATSLCRSYTSDVFLLSANFCAPIQLLSMMNQTLGELTSLCRSYNFLAPVTEGRSDYWAFIWLKQDEDPTSLYRSYNSDQDLNTGIYSGLTWLPDFDTGLFRQAALSLVQA